MKRKAFFLLLGLNILFLLLPISLMNISDTNPESVLAAPTAPTIDSLVIIHTQSTDFVGYVIGAFRNWYNAKYGISIIVDNIEMTSSAASAQVSTWGGAPLADVWWGGGEFEFEIRRNEGGLLEPYRVLEDVNIASYLSGWHLKDDSGDFSDPVWYGAALSGFGIMYNTEYLAANGLEIPRTWGDLTNHSYKGHITMASPQFSGLTTATVKMLLQEFNTQADSGKLDYSGNASEGWSFWAKIAGNMGEFASSSSKVPRNVFEGTYGIGITIDYFAWDYIALSSAIGFTYGGVSTFSPDPAAVLTGAPNMVQGKRFMDYLTSTEGQVKLGKYRIPVNREAVPESTRIPRAWDATGNINPMFPLLDPFNVSVDSLIHSRARELFAYWFVLGQNAQKAADAYDAIGKATDAIARTKALALYTKLPSTYDGTLGDLRAQNYTDPAIRNLWATEGAFHFDAAKTEAQTIIDQFAPEIGLQSPLVNETTYPPETTITLYIVDDNPISQVLYHWDTEPNSTLPFPYSITLPSTNGTHILKVFAKDTLGNEGQAVFVFQVNIYSTLPSEQSTTSKPTKTTEITELQLGLIEIVTVSSCLGLSRFYGKKQKKI
ncbi:MAG: ABC transporter substrate-binding protein [Candidatus Thorarchaeota archaeon]